MSKKRRRSRQKRWILLLILMVGLGLVMVNSKKETEAKEERAFFENLSNVLWAGIRSLGKSAVKGQSILLDLVVVDEPAFAEIEKVGTKESSLPFSLEERILFLEEDSLRQIEEENRQYREQQEEKAKEEAQQQLLAEEAQEQETDFVPAGEKSQLIDWENYQEAEKLLEAFYTVDPTTEALPELFQIETLLHTDCTIDPAIEGPQILLYHTHSQETFVDSVPGEEADSIVGAGEILAKLLEGYGYRVLHHKGEYDVESRDQAYNVALPKIEQLLAENPSIQVVLDLHRDAVAEETRLVSEVGGRPTAKVMFFNGLSRTRQQGEVSYLENPYLQENLAFSFQMKAFCEEYYPGFARDIYLRAYRYNMHLSPKTLLIELGAQTNTVEEIHHALEPLAHGLDYVLGRD